MLYFYVRLFLSIYLDPMKCLTVHILWPLRPNIQPASYSDAQKGAKNTWFIFPNIVT